ncbi:prosaposin [Arctopsyche grandis]|uniref:prosaposin n=1 Tax=Arctopsyche grandis TaxID=121162 RepID=UPI00406D8302
MARQAFALLLLAVAFCGFVATTPLLGEKQCTWGPSYWCSNITNAKGCGAVKHCIKSVWEKQTMPEDKDEICKICTDMVTQARDQLESNQTQEDLMAVFEGSCKLIPLKVVSNECIKLVDDFIPELVETLASQMNPQVVCSVAGLCNSARIDKMLANMYEQKDLASENEKNVQMCNGCFTVVDKMKKNFDDTSYEKFLENILRACGKLGSFSDSCATAVFVNFEDLYGHVQNNFNSENICHLAGTCSYKFHQHKPSSEEIESADSTSNVEITPMGNVGRLDIDASDDVPCQLCEQLVNHLRDILIANTTEAEFKRVLDGLCKQTGSFQRECLSISEQYYPVIYDFLVRELDSTEVCLMVGICHNGKTIDVPIAPLVPTHVGELAIKVLHKASDKPLIGKDEANSYKNKDKSVQVLQPELAQLPIDRILVQLPQSKEVCTFCQYFLHFIQVQISDSHTEENIKSAVEKACRYLPTSVGGQCEAFVEAYGNAVIALLVQEIDPSQVCPALTLCPKQAELPKIDVLMTTGSGSKTNCPLCLFAVEQLETMLKNNSTEENIQNALDNLCSHLPAKLRSECTDFVDTYSKQLVEMLAAEFTPQEVCVYLKLCVDTRPDISMLTKIDEMHSKKAFMADRNNFKRPLLPKNMLANVGHEKDGQIDTNAIPDSTYNGKPLIYAEVSRKEVKTSPQCVICEFVMTQLEKELHDKATADEIKKVVHSVCSHMPKNVKKECDEFVDKYADIVIALLTQELSPADVCSMLKFCDGKNTLIRSSVAECAVCNEIIGILQQILSNPNVDRNLEHIIEKTCYAIPRKYFTNCVNLMRTYGEELIHMVVTLADSEKICTEIKACGDNRSYVNLMSTRTKRSAQQLLGAKKCTWGPSYWCENENQANECHALNHCREKVWFAQKPSN